MARLSADPYTILADLRAHEPVSWIPEVGMWLATRYDDVVAVLADFDTYTVDAKDSIIRDMFVRHMMTIDGPEQVRHKKQCIPMFRPRDLAATIGAGLEARVARLVDAFADAGAAELRTQLARPLAIETVTEILGLPMHQVSRIAGWYDRFAAALANFARDPRIRAEGREAGVQFAELVRPLLVSVGDDASDSLLNRLAHSGDRLTDDEIVSNALIIMFGGIETTEAQLCNTVWSLLAHPAQLAEVRSDRGLLDAAIEESLRWQPSVQSCTRHVKRDVRLRDVDLAPENVVQCMLGAANRDPERFEQPDRFDIHRANARDHLAFGYGRHFCLGAPLARAEIRAALVALLDRFADLAFDQARPATLAGHEFRKPPELWVTWRDV